MLYLRSPSVHCVLLVDYLKTIYSTVERVLYPEVCVQCHTRFAGGLFATTKEGFTLHFCSEKCGHDYWREYGQFGIKLKAFTQPDVGVSVTRSSVRPGRHPDLKVEQSTLSSSQSRKHSKVMACEETHGETTKSPNKDGPLEGVCIQCHKTASREHEMITEEGYKLTFCSGQCCCAYWEEFAQFSQDPTAYTQQGGGPSASQQLPGSSKPCFTSGLNLAHKPADIKTAE